MMVSKNAFLVVIAFVFVSLLNGFQIKSMIPRGPRGLQSGVSFSSSPSSLKYRIGNDEVDSLLQNPGKFRQRGREKEFGKVNERRSLGAVEITIGRICMVIFTVDIVREYITGHSFFELFATDLGLSLPVL